MAHFSGTFDYSRPSTRFLFAKPWHLSTVPMTTIQIQASNYYPRNDPMNTSPRCKMVGRQFLDSWATSKHLINGRYMASLLDN